LKAQQAKVAEQGVNLTEAHGAAIEKKSQDYEFNGEIDTAHRVTWIYKTPSTSAPSRA